ncbi:dockerin type I repeat protein [Anaerobacterium chartisolvens]|uniref:Dockerin type I repeat protein n=1 Tax=Anaerobacterium chartisolvens TaxID=1297424 RepID=A0A369BAE5_9FIRM|nr:glycoside hydrolase family 44 protein [Anaerobacterium chartisolvens]RCX17536.1 dockerin type I repeat protein [Anaerobacterium chartisolvens]
MIKVQKLRKAGAFIVGAALLAASVFPTSIAAANFSGSVNVSIDTAAERAVISPYIYGGNWEFDNAKLTSKRMGGNRITGYNWENNYSSAGSDWLHSSDTYLLSNGNIPAARWSEPGVVFTDFHDKNLEAGEEYSLVTLQAAGYVCADADGTVGEAETAPSDRWKEVKFQKDSPFSLTPDTTDDYVYMDEFVNFLVNKYGNASTPTGIKGYAIDNEPALWPGTHARIHPETPTCQELVDKNINLAKAVKGVDPAAEVFGLVAYGFAEYNTFQDASDWASVKGDYDWFLDYYLDSMKKASDQEGERLVDVLDLHWYPEARGGDQRICFNEDPANIECNKARLQAPRTLWDPTYTETSWIAQSYRDSLPIIPKIQQSIDEYNPGTKLAFTEYDYGAGDHITGGIAQADVLGIFGKYGVYFSTLWGDGSYCAAGTNIYTNYDGKGSKYGNTKVKAETSDIENTSVYASIDGDDDSKLHVIMINKNYESPMTVNFDISGSKNYTSGRVWAFDRGSTDIVEKSPIGEISGNQLSYTVPALTVCHIVLESGTQGMVYGDANNDGAVNSMDFALLKKHLLQSDYEYVSYLDLNLDNSVNTIDFSIMKQYLLGIITKLPHGTAQENQPPTAAFTVSPEEGFTGDSISFDASASTDPEGQIYIYSWDFGNGKEGLGQKVIHKYNAPGTYTIKLTVTDNKGLTDSATGTVLIETATGDNSNINFEDGTINGFTTNDTTTSKFSVAEDKAFMGTKSLKWDAVGTQDGVLDAKVDSSTPVLTPGGTMTFRVWIPSGAPIQAIQPYVMPHDASWAEIEWHSAWAGYYNIKKDDWNEFTVTLPQGANASLTQQQFGVQVTTSGEGEFTMYIDSIDW